VIDEHPTQKRVLELFRQGRRKEAPRLQDEFLRQVKASGEDHCPCRTPCKFHGKCVECVITHRGHGDHLPYCFRRMVNRRMEAISALTEHSFGKEGRETSR